MLLICATNFASLMQGSGVICIGSFDRNLYALGERWDGRQMRCAKPAWEI